ARRHATALLGLVDEALGELGATPADIARMVMADGPGSFTGLRVAASVAKALTWRRSLEWRVAPSLLARALPHAPPGGGSVLALSDALRGELFAGCWRFTPASVRRLGPGPRAVTVEFLATASPVDIVVGSIPPALLEAVAAATGCQPIVGEAALPDARALLALLDVPHSTALVVNAPTWQPDYGRPAEAQVVWERAHGRELPSAPGIAR
ncbi:MAG: tRNA (adenosine(37)-N6)-threonylcarbamoyltransferase complex dimerization subunit type 1 TsaB, partial [Gemmatimonadales bacterium]